MRRIKGEGLGPKFDDKKEGYERENVKIQKVTNIPYVKNPR